MTDENAPATDLPVLHALLICRGIEANETGELTLHNVVEIVPVEEVPTEVGPLTFVALLRNLPPGPSKGSFVISTGDPDEPGGRLPFEAEIPAGVGERQMAMQITVPKLPVSRPGWFHLGFEWDGQILGENKFLVGMVGKADDA